MPRAIPNLLRRTVTLDTGRRSLDIPVDGSGHLRHIAALSDRTVTRAAAGDGPIGFKGHAATFNSRTWIGGKRWGFWEEIAPTAFDKTLGEADVRFLINHDPNLVLGRNTAGTLRLSTDEVGLAVDADMAPTSYGLDLAILLERGDVTQMSFAFDMIAYEWTELADGSELLRPTEVALWDVAAVTYPAYADTDASLRGDLLAAARSAGFDALDLDRLGERLADPDPDLITSLRALARRDAPAPAETTQTPEANPPAETTGERTISPLALATLAKRMTLMEI